MCPRVSDRPTCEALRLALLQETCLPQHIYDPYTLTWPKQLPDIVHLAALYKPQHWRKVATIIILIPWDLPRLLL